MKKDKKMYFFHNVHTKYYPLSWVKYKSSQTINKWTTPDTALWQLQMLLCFWAAHLLHGEPYTILALLPQIKFVLLRRQGEEDYIFICLSIFSDPDQTKPDRRVIMLFAFPFTHMNECKGKCSEEMGSYYVPFVWFLCDRREEMKHI